MARKEFGRTWWAKRWIESLERRGWRNRLQRGRSYARNKRVVDIQIRPGHVSALVKGTRPHPYRVEIHVPMLSDEEWARVLDVMASRAVFAAKLLSGEMPETIEEAFEAAGVHLFPTAEESIEMSCSCPDWAVPCKHIAATYYVLGEMFDYDPFLMFLLRGRSREQIMDALQLRHTRETSEAEVEEEASAPLLHMLSDFWGDPDHLVGLDIRVEPPPVPQAMLLRLGPFPDPEQSSHVEEVLSRVYEMGTRRALRLAYPAKEETSP